MIKHDFNPEEYDLDGLRQMIAAERMDAVTLHDLYEYFSCADGEDANRIIAALRDGTPHTVGIAVVLALKKYFRSCVTDDQAVDAAQDLHDDLYDEAVIARKERIE